MIRNFHVACNNRVSVRPTVQRGSHRVTGYDIQWHEGVATISHTTKYHTCRVRIALEKITGNILRQHFQGMRARQLSYSMNDRVKIKICDYKIINAKHARPQPTMQVTVKL